ncbi:MAG: primosomal protein N' [Desulfurivibrio sp.]|nr:primosomal protein N' [Desulfurivibrio sp.]
MISDEAPATPYLEVAVCAPIEHPLTYAPPPEAAILQPGQRLLVPLGKRQITGYLLACQQQPPVVGAKIRPALAVLDPEPLFPAAMIPFFRWIADYYHHPIGEIIQSALPSGLDRRSVPVIELTAAGTQALMAPPSAEETPVWLPELLARGELSPATSARIIKQREGPFGRWRRRGWLQLGHRLRAEKVRPKTETVALPLASPTTTGQRQQQPSLKPSETKTLALLWELAGAEQQSAVPRRELTRQYPGAGRALKGLTAHGLVELSQRRLFRDPLGEPPPFFTKPAQLTAEQQAVLAAIQPAVAGGRYAPFLLHGVTGSGKTEVYLQAAATALAQGRQVLVLVPEIALATQLEGHFCSRFGDIVALLHSGLAAGARFDQWSLLLAGQAQIAIGARSAIFAPLPNPGLIIVDEEHDPAYKQEDQPRYNARDLAVLRGLQQQATVILGSATPAVASFHQAQAGKFKLLTMAKRVEDRPLPTVEIIDLQEVKTVSGRPPLFSPQLVKALKENLAGGRQSLVFLNRRGFANLMLCKDCGRPIQCQHCQVSLTLHKKRGQLLCHHCGFHLPRDVVCPHCRSGTLVAAGFGTERLEEELTRLLPAARIARLDQDTSRDRRRYLAVLKAVRDQEIDVLIGTQMITKGHHFPQVTLVGIVWADAGLGIPDYKAAERTFQLLTQVSGRAGRGEHPGRVIVQTLQADHYSVSLAQAHDYQGLYQREIALRRRLGFPPFGRLINLRLDGENEQRCQELAAGLGAIARRQQPAGVQVLGPAPAPLARLRGRYRWQLLLKGAEVAAIHTLCRGICAEFAKLPGASTVKLSLDVDPENMV